MATLHTQYEKVNSQTTISVTDQKILHYLELAGDRPCDSVLADEHDIRIFQSLSELRTGIISWYDFATESDVLEIGGGFGTITGKLCELCGHVTVTERLPHRAEAIAKRYLNVSNLNVYSGDVLDMEFPGQYDYILLIGVLELVGNGKVELDLYVKFIKELWKYLKPDGRFLIAVENRLGLKYFCGAAEPHTGRPFDGIDYYSRGLGRGCSFSRSEITSIVRQAGMKQIKFYYPLPDYKLPQLIYTDKMLPQRNLKERLIPYYKKKDWLVAKEKRLYDDIIENEVFPFMANSFLVECGKDNQLGTAVYAAITTDRGPERGFATIIYEDNHVVKRPLYEKGYQNLKKMYENIKDLEQHGIPVVKHIWKQNGVEMPFIARPTLASVLKERILTDREGCISILDQLYFYILQASEQVDSKDNQLLQKQLKYAENEDEADSWRKLNFGPIIRKAYLELIPLNCFYDIGSGEFLFFDQEFFRENYPAKYVLFRAILHIYCFIPNAEKYLPQKELKVRYGLEETWEIYIQEEERFILEVRNREQYRNFYEWTKLDQSWINENVRRLSENSID